MEQQEFLQNFFHSLMKKHNKERGEEMLSIDVRTLQIPDIKFDQFLVNELWLSMMHEEDLEVMVM
jgi:hypothetical protein